MSRVSSRFRVALPKSLARRCGVRPGDEIRWEAVGDVIRLVLRARKVHSRDIDKRISSFDQASKRQAERERNQQAVRGWSREDLYDRDSTD